MITRYKFVDMAGDEIDTALFQPWTPIDVTCIQVEFWPGLDPGEEDEMIMTLRYDHDKPRRWR